MTETLATTLRVGLLQVAADEPIGAARARAEAAVAQAAAQGAALLVLPEFAPRRWFAVDLGRPEDLEPQPGWAASWAAELARRQRCYLLAADVEQDGDGWFNVARLHGPRGCALAHRKRHLPDEPNFRERAWYSRDAGPLQSGDAAGARVGALTCSDAMFPDEARALGRQGCDVILVARATPAGELSERRWSMMLRADAIVSGAYVVSVNRVGREGAVEFAGSSVVVSPGGEVLADLGPDPGKVVVDLDLEAARAAKHEYPVLTDRDDWA